MDFLIDLSRNQDLSEEFAANPNAVLSERGVSAEAKAALLTGDQVELMSLISQKDHAEGEGANEAFLLFIFTRTYVVDGK